MATFTVSATGGNWSSTSTWVGGVLPAAGDDIVANASSGNLTVDGNRTCLSINFTNYTNTFTINNGVTLSVSINSGTAITLGSGMTYTSSTTGVLSHIAANNTTINFNGITIPRLTLGGNGGGTRTVTISGTTPTVNILTSNSTFGSVSLQGTTLNLTTSLTLTAGRLTGNPPNINAGGTFLISGNGSCAGFTVFSGTALSLQSNLSISGGAIVFNSGSSLTHNNQTLSIVDGPVSYNAISTIEWWNVTHSSTLGNITHLSDLNIANNFTITGGVYGATVTGGPWNINIKGSFIMTTNGTFSFSTLTINLIGTGTIEAVNGSNISSATAININTSNPLGYTIGTVSRNFLGISNTVFNLVGTSVATVNSGHTLTFANATITTNNTSTGANIPGGSEIIWVNLIFPAFSGNLTLTYDTKFSGNITSNGTVININGATGRLLIGGNLTLPNNTSLGGTSGGIEFYGSNNQNWNNTGATCSYPHNVTVNKSGGTLTLLGTINWGTTNRTLQRTAGNINPGTSTVTIPNAAVTISNMIFNNLTITAGPTITQNSGNTINGNLTCNGTTRFSGDAGWTAANFIDTTAGTTITLQSGINYTVTSNLRLLGTNASPILLSGSSPTTRAYLTLNYGASMLSGDGLVSHAVYFVRATRIDSSLGQTIWNTFGSISTPLVDTVNWNPGSRPNPTSYTYIT
jgi:hypothetical protein